MPNPTTDTPNPYVTEEGLAGLEALCNAATPGPWEMTIDEYGKSGMVAIEPIGRVMHDTEWADPEDWQRDQDNAEAIVALRNAAPLLIAAVRELRKEIDEYYKPELSEATRSSDNYSMTCDALREENERLRTALKSKRDALKAALDWRRNGTVCTIGAGELSLWVGDIDAAIGPQAPAPQGPAPITDTQRLDWLDSRGDIIEIVIDGDLEGERMDLAVNKFLDDPQKRDLRAAIDDAIRAKGPK